MKWIAVFLTAIVLAMPLGFTDTQTTAQSNLNAEAKAVSATDLHFKQIGQGFGDFVFHIRSFLTFDEKSKIELLKERNAELQTRQQAWLDAEAKAMASGSMSAEEKQDITSMLQAEHEAIIKEHLRLTTDMLDIQLKAKAQSNAQLESEANSAAEAEGHSGLSLGLIGSGHGLLTIGSDNEIDQDMDTGVIAHEGTKAEVKGNVVLSAEAIATYDKLVSSFSNLSSQTKLGLSVAKESGSAEIKAVVKGDTLTSEQAQLWTTLQNQVKASVEASARAEAVVNININHKFSASGGTHIDTAAEAQAVVEKRLGFETSHVTTETRNGETVYVVTGSETKAIGRYELTKSFEVVIEANTGLILSANMNAHFDTISSASGSVSSNAQATSGNSASATSGSTGTSGSTNAGASGSASGSVSGGVSGSTSGSTSNSASGSASGSAATIGGLTIK